MTYNIVIGTYEGILYGIEITHDNNKSINNIRIIFSNKNHQSCIKSVIFCENTYLLSSSSDNTICLYNIKNGVELGHLSESKEYIKLIDLKNSLVGGVDHNGYFNIWDTKQWINIYTLNQQIYDNSIILSTPHPIYNGLLLVYDNEYYIGLLDLYQQKYMIKTKSNQQINIIEWSPSGNMYLTVENYCIISFYGISSSMEIIATNSYKLDDHIICVSIVDDKYCYVGTKNGNIILISQFDGVIYSWKAHDNKRVKLLKIMYNIHLMISVDSIGVIKFWNLLHFNESQPDLQSEFVIPFRPTCIDCSEIC